MKCILHIGTEKTGSTSLQNFLKLNAAELRKQSVCFPTIAENPNHYVLAMATGDFAEPNLERIRADFAIDSADQQRALARQLGHEIRTKFDESGCETLVLSSENFHHGMRSTASVMQLRTFLTSLGFENTQIVVYLRRPADLVNSWYSTALRWGDIIQSPPNALECGCDSGAIDLRYDATLQRWERVFGRDSMRVRIFERKTLVGGSVIDDFATVAGISVDSSLVIPRDDNVSLSHDTIEVMRRVNRTLGKPTNDGGVFLRNVIADVVEQIYGTDTKYTMPSELYEECQAAYAASNERVRSIYFPQRATLFSDSRTPPASTPTLDTGTYDRITNSIVAEVRAAARSERAMRHLPNKLTKVVSKQYAHDHQSGGTLSFVDRLLGRQTALPKAA